VSAPVTDILSGLWEWVRSMTPLPIKQYYWAAANIFTNPWFWAPLLVIFVAERLWPVFPTDKRTRIALAEDSIWLNIEIAVRATLLPLTAGVVTIAWERSTNNFSIPLLAGFPSLARVAVSLVLWDLIEYTHHWLRHRYTALWHFHVIHHSQRHLNVLTTGRGHVLEYLFIEPITIIFMLALQLTPFELMGTGLAIGWYTRLSHANVRTNFGALGLVLVSPQHHRIHHSIELVHQNKNLGLLLTIWDRLFGTLCTDRTSYPSTGVTDVNFVPPGNANPVSWAKLFARQFIYPLQKIGDSMVKHLPRRR
jgi:sterol desaturase/sphingolipid hydroxylase (fatty acid hydroxylase superfamily)